MKMIALEPPGNVARDLALYRRELFSRLGDASALAFPEIAPLATASAAGRLAPGSLELCWRRVDGAFASTSLRAARGILYLALDGPLSELSARASEALEDNGPKLERHLDAGIGIFLCRHADTALALTAAQRIGPPRVSFLDCSIVLYDFLFGDDPFAAVRWRERARSKRRSHGRG